MITNFDKQNKLFDEGYCFETGKGVPQNFELAIQKYEQAGKLGHANAYCRAGVCCQFKMNPMNVNRAVHYYNLSIKEFELDQDHNDAMGYVYLSECYKMGIGVEQDNEKAKELMKKAQLYGVSILEINKLKKENKIE